MSTFDQPLAPANDDASVIDPNAKVGTPKPVPWWEADDAPEGAHSESLYTVDDNGAKHFAGPTHYLHLADGRVVAGYGGGTHHSEVVDGRDRIVPIIGSYAG